MKLMIVGSSGQCKNTTKLKYCQKYKNARYCMRGVVNSPGPKVG
jgi:hypothetical protein